LFVVVNLRAFEVTGGFRIEEVIWSVVNEQERGDGCQEEKVMWGCVACNEYAAIEIIVSHF
jgi:hypothetical protein